MQFILEHWGTISQTEFYRGLLRFPWQIICPVAAIVLVALIACVEQVRRHTRFKEISRVALHMLLPPLIVVAVLAVGNYNNFGSWRYGTFFNAYEFYHYYIGSKYAPEIHYKDLYNATLIADDETGLKFHHSEGKIKNLNPNWKADKETYHLTLEQVKQRKGEIKARFTPERWQEFLSDIKFFKKKLVGGRWDGVLRDKGYNGSPAWSAVVGGLLSNNVPTSNRSGMLFLASLDLILVALAMCFVIWAYGLRAALLLLILWGTSYVMSYSHMKGAYLRTDFVMPIIISMCLIKKNHYAPAGVLMGYAAVARIFPTVFLFGMGARMVWVSLRALAQLRREYAGQGLAVLAVDFLKANRNYIVFFCCVAMTVSAMFVTPIAYTGDMELWRSYQDKIGDHADDISPWRVGFKYLFIGDVTPQANELKSLSGVELIQDPVKYFNALTKHFSVKMTPKFYTDNRLLWYSLMAAMLLVCLLASRGLRDHDAIALSFVPCFFLAAPTYYYYIMLLIPMLFFAPYLNRPGRAFGTILLLAMAMPGYFLYSIWKQQFPTYYWHSVMYFVLCLYMVSLALWDTVCAWRRGTESVEHCDDKEVSEAVNCAETVASDVVVITGEVDTTQVDDDSTLVVASP